MNPSPSFGSTDNVVIKENMQNNINSSKKLASQDDNDDAMLKKASIEESSSLAADSPLPTYQTSQTSDFYLSANALLKSGDFEDALSTIEEGIAWTQQQLQVANVDASLHESMAPFHYLYGTTLLYSIEESNDTSTMQEPLTTVEAAAHEDEENETVPTEPYDGNDDAPEAPSVEDMEIAWEHLETARTILESMLLRDAASASLRADLAQVLLRAGDLQRLNGAYEASVTDYTACLSFYDQNQAPLYSRKRADVHCNLGAVYFNMVVEAKKADPSSSDAGNSLAPHERESKMAYHRGRGYHHYFECARTLVGMIAHGLNVADPKQWFDQVEASVEPAAPCSLYDVQSEHYPQFIRSQLRSLRLLVSSQVSTASQNESSDEVQDCLALLEEIQETIEEAETSEQGVVEATAMKEEITALVAAQCEPHEEEGFGSTAAAASTAVAQTIAVVRKKKPREEETKCPADPAKRMKSSE